MSSKGAGALGFSALIAAFLFPLLGTMAGTETAINPRSFYPEGPVVVGHTLYYAEMGSDRVMSWDGKVNATIWKRPGCGPTSVSRGGEGALVVLCHEENEVARVTTTGKTLEIIDRDSSGKTFMDPNASVNDSHGGVYFSSSGVFSPDAPAQGAVLYLDARDHLTRLAEGIHYSNGVALTPDGKTLYVSEHLSRRVLAFDVETAGVLSNRRVFVALDDLEPAVPNRGWEVGPDGLAIDREGNLYIAEYGAGHILVVSRAGQLVATMPVGEPYVTAATFGARQDRIFVTAPASLYDPQEPGKVYSLKNPAYRPD